MTAQISICIPAYNGSEFIAAAIRSVLDQSFRDYELVIVDDASNDATLQIAASFNDDRIHIERNDRNLGLVGNWNRSIEHARAALVLLLHQDDVLGAGFLEDVVEFFARHENVGMVSAGGRPIDGRGRVNAAIRTFNPRYRRREALPKVLNAGDEAALHLLRYGAAISGVVVRKAVYEAVGTFDAAYRYSADEEMWVRIASRYGVGLLPGTIVYQRNHRGQFRDATWKQFDFLDQYLAVQRRRVSYVKSAENAFDPSYLVSRSGASIALRLVASGDASRAAAILDATERLYPPIRHDTKHAIARLMARSPRAGRFICRTVLGLR